MKNKFNIKSIALIGVFAAFVFASHFFRFPIVFSSGKSAIHLGNILCLLSGFVLGPIQGGLASGLGAMFFDIADPEYISECWITFINKFIMAFLCGYLTHGKYALKIQIRNQARYIIAGIIGGGAYVVLHLTKTFIKAYYLLGYSFEATIADVIGKAGISLSNMAIAVVFSIMLYNVINVALIHNKLKIDIR